jgi:hypothetical protein
MRENVNCMYIDECRGELMVNFILFYVTLLFSSLFLHSSSPSLLISSLFLLYSFLSSYFTSLLSSIISSSHKSSYSHSFCLPILCRTYNIACSTYNAPSHLLYFIFLLYSTPFYSTQLSPSLLLCNNSSLPCSTLLLCTVLHCTVTYYKYNVCC